MLNFCSLYSSSSGNSLFVQTENSNILVDAGVSAKKIVDGLKNINIDASDIDAILVTHEHSDHVQGLGTLSKKFDIPVYANKKTWDAMSTQRDKINDYNINFFNNNENFEIGDLIIHPFDIPHDAANPCGFNFICNNDKLSIATDLGHMTTSIIDCLENSKFLMLEANYDPEVLKCSKYPYLLKTRISGPNGHLSNNLAGKTICHLINSGLKNVMLGHLSKENNFPELAYSTVLEELAINNYDENVIGLSVASRDVPGELLNVG